VTRSASAPAAADPATVATALRAVKGGDDSVGGMLVAGGDGLVLAAETTGVQVDMLGVMAAVVAGIASQIAAQALAGDAMSCMVEGSAGHVAVFPLKPAMVLVVVSQSEVRTGRFNLAARGVLCRLQEAVDAAVEKP
jgi:predicted regulator of Ras-like GTPase activity (Roadblock/LC7/MglB family)